MIQVYGYLPAWGLPDISPYVTKLIFYMTITKIPFTYHSQDLSKLDADAPYGKLPYIVDDDGTKIGDSNLIIEYLQRKHGDPLDGELSDNDKAVCLAFDRMISEHLYWSGVIQPRWRQDEGWEVYIPYIIGSTDPPPTEVREALDAFRARILAQFQGQGMGRRDAECVCTFYKKDIDALSTFLGGNKYFLGAKVHVIDTMFYSMLRHLVDQPQKWVGTGYIESKGNLVDYMQRMREEFGI
jgi:isoprene-epoxide---glutathione S-transferase